MLVAALHMCPRDSAKALPDQLVNKLILEVTQVLECGTRNACTALDLPHIQAPWLEYERVINYPKSCPNHPCSQVAAYDQTWKWCYDHLGALIDEHYHRYWNKHAFDGWVQQALLESRLLSLPNGYAHSYSLQPRFYVPDHGTPPICSLPSAVLRFQHCMFPAKLKWDTKRGPLYARWTRRFPPAWVRRVAANHFWAMVPVGPHAYEFRGRQQ